MDSADVKRLRVMKYISVKKYLISMKRYTLRGKLPQTGFTILPLSMIQLVLDGWHTPVEAPKYVHTHLARTTDHGKTWEYVSTINKAVDGTITTDEGVIEGVWRHEVPTLAHDQKDSGREWKLFWHKYFTSPPYEAEDRMFQYGWIAYKYAPEPEGPWSHEIPLFGAGTFPLEPFETLVDLNDLHKDLREFICYSEPGSLVKDNVLYIILNGHVIKGGNNIGKVFLLAFYDHGDTWKYIHTL